MDIGSGYTTGDEAALCHLLAKRTKLLHRLAGAYQQVSARLERALESAKELAEQARQHAERVERLESEAEEWRTQNERLQREAADLNARLRRYTHKEVA